MRKYLKKTIFKKYFKSLQFRFFVLFIAVGTLPIMMIKYEILKSFEEQSVKQRSTMVQNQCVMIADQLSNLSYIDGNKSEVIEMRLEMMANLYNGRIVIANRDFQIIKDTYGLDENKTIISEEVLRCFQGEDTLRYEKSSEFIEMVIPVKDSVSKDIIGAMIVSSPTDDIGANKEELSRQVFVLQIAMSVGILAIAFYMSGLLVKPFGKVTQSLEEVTGTVLEEDISILDYTETRLLSDAYNRMLSRMKALDDSRQEFVANVSHELKTPITSMKVLADSLLMQEDVPVELYQEFMKDIAEEIDREDKIINDLLSLVKMDKKAADVNIKETSINELLELVVKRLKPIAAKSSVELVFESFKPVMAEVDETKLTLALSNLVENSIKYNRENGWVRLSLNVDHKYFYVKVEDSGFGIPEDAQEHIFERFYRVDKSHSREIGGTGLGLAITRNAVLMHRGAIRVYSKEGEGTTFTVRIPLAYMA